MLLRWISSSSTTSRLFTRRSRKPLSSAERLVERLLVDRLLQERERAQPQAAAALGLVDGDDVHRDVAGARVVLEPVEDRPAVDVRQPMSSVMASGLNFAGQRQARVAAQGHHALEALLARQIQQDAGERRVVLDDQQHAVAGLDRGAVVLDLILAISERRLDADLGALPRASCRRCDSRAVGRCAGRLRRHLPIVAAESGPAGRRRGHVALRQVEGEGAALARRRWRRWISPPSSRAISRLMDRPRPVPPYLRLVVPSACWNASKMMLLLVLGDADAGVARPRRRSPARRWFSVGASKRIQPRCATSMRSDDLALLGELEGVGEQVLEDLLQPLRSV